MTFKVLISIETATADRAISAPLAGQWQAAIINANGEIVQAQRTDAPVFEAFTTIPAGAYTAQAARLDSNGDVISKVEAQFDTGPDAVLAPDPAPTPDPTPAPTVTVQVPASLKVSVTQE